MPTCSNSDVCAYLLEMLDHPISAVIDLLQSGSDIRNELDWNWGVLGGPSFNDPLGYPITGSVHDDLATIENEIGAPATPGDTLFGKLYDTLDAAGTAADNSAAAVDNINAIITQLGYAAHPSVTVYSDIQDIKSSLTSFAASLITIIGDIASVQTTLANVALAIVASWPKTGAGDLVQTIGDFLEAIGIGPGQSHLTIGTLHDITSGLVVSKPTGAYGVQVNLDVPAYWGRVSELPNVYIPPVGRFVQWSQWGDAGTPDPIETQFPTYYPLHPACDQISIDLKPGVTGQYAWLELH